MASKYHAFKRNVKYFLKRKYLWTLNETNHWMINNAKVLRQFYADKVTPSQTAKKISVSRSSK